MFRITVPVKFARKLLSFNLIRNKSKGFVVPCLSKRAFDNMLRGWFDGDGSISEKKSSQFSFSLYGHPKSLSYIQKTLLEHYNLYVPWYPAKRTKNFGALNTSKEGTLSYLFYIMYGNRSYPFLKRKRLRFDKFMEKHKSI